MAGRTDLVDEAGHVIDAVVHDLRTPLSAMSGWLDVLETQIDAPGPVAARALAGLRRSIDQQLDAIARLSGDMASAGTDQGDRSSGATGAGRVALPSRVHAAWSRLPPDRRRVLAAFDVTAAAAEPTCLDGGTALDDALGLLLTLVADVFPDQPLEGAGPRRIVCSPLNLTVHLRTAAPSTGAVATGASAAPPGLAVLDALCNGIRSARVNARGRSLASVWVARRALAGAGLRSRLEQSGAADWTLTLEPTDGHLARPLIQSEAQSPPRLPAGDEVPTRPSGPLQERTILIVDDQKDIREMLGLWLRCHHFSVILAESASEARQRLAEAGAVGAALIDIRMPDEDGLSLIRTIREHEAQRGAEPMPALAITAQPSADTRRSAIQAGFTELLAKPLHLRTLLEDLRRLTEGRIRRAPAI